MRSRCVASTITSLQPKNVAGKPFQRMNRAPFPDSRSDVDLKLTLLSDQSTWHSQPTAANKRWPFRDERGASAQNQAGKAPLEVILRLRRRSAESASPPEKLLDPGRPAVNIFSFLSPLNLSVSAGRPANRWI